jgi:hypothetical protein
MSTDRPIEREYLFCSAGVHALDERPDPRFTRELNSYQRSGSGRSRCRRQ